MKKIGSLLLCLLVFVQIGHAASGPACDQRLQKYWNKILELPEARQLIEQIDQEGPIQIRVASNGLSQQFGAYWERQQRVIGIFLPTKVSEGRVIGSLLFELHNALSDPKFDHLDYLASSRQISREKYVESMERLEFQNSKKAAALAQEGIDKGIFPENAKLPTYSCFEEHYYYQKMSGHSNAFTEAYDQLRS